MSIADNLYYFRQKLAPFPGARLLAVSKTKPAAMLAEAYEAGQRLFGENHVQEMVAKQAALPADAEWHLIGHLQTNKVRYIAPFVSLIHSVDSLKLLQEINKQGAKAGRVINCLLQIYIAQEETKFGLSEEEALAILQGPELAAMEHVCITGFMGMATNTGDMAQVRREFASLKRFFDQCVAQFSSPRIKLRELSMGMSSDYEIALEEGATLVRVGSAVFGGR